MTAAGGSKFLSQAEFARHRGVSRKAVTGWKQKDLLVFSAEGLVDVDASEWNLDQRPASYRGGVTHRPVRTAPGNTARQEPKAPARPKSDTWQTIAEAMPRPDLAPTEGDGGNGPIDLTDLPLPDAIRRKENFLGLQRKQEVEKNDRKLVDREAAEKLFFDTARDFRDAWLSWPARVAIVMADELKVDPRALTTILNAHVKQHLSELGDPRPSSADTSSLSASWRKGVTPTPDLNVVEWAEQYRRLSKESSNGGRFIVSRVEVARGPMLAATEPGVMTITLMACTQLLKTTVIENILGRFIHIDPCPILVVQPKDDAAETFSKDRLAPMIRDTAVLKDIFGDLKARDAGSTLTHKQFPGGHITLVGSNSPTNLAMRPIRLLTCDEIDKYPLSAGGEGSPIDLAEERQAEFKANSLSVRACSPTVAGRSAIEASYEESDQRKAFVVCPHCKGWHPLEWERVRFDKDQGGKIKAETGRYECVGCDQPWTEPQRLLALRKIEWRQTRAFTCCGENQTPERWAPEAYGVARALCIHCGAQAVPNDHAGFQASKLYAPKQTIRETVAKFARALRRGPEALRTFFNTQLARTWKEGADAPEWQDVYARKDRYRSGTVPAGGLILFGGVDVQKDRLEASVWAFGRNRERWLIEHRVLPGDTNRAQVWKDLEAMFDETWEHEGGADMKVRDWGVDSSGFTAEVYAFVRTQAGRPVHAVDGQDSYQAAFLGVGAKDATPAGKKLRRGLKTIRVGASFAKQELMGCLALQRPLEGQPFPAGFVHLPDDVTEDQVRQLTAEELVTHVSRGRTRREWVPIGGRRNEVLDCANYARGLAAMRGWDRWRETHWRELEGSLGIERQSRAIPLDELPPAIVAAAATGNEASRNLQRSGSRRSKVRSRVAR